MVVIIVQRIRCKYITYTCIVQERVGLYICMYVCVCLFVVCVYLYLKDQKSTTGIRYFSDQ